MKKLQDFDYVVLYSMFSQAENTVTIADVMAKYNWTHGKAHRCLERLVKHGKIRRKTHSFWNGMYYAIRFYYW